MSSRDDMYQEDDDGGDKAADNAFSFAMKITDFLAETFQMVNYSILTASLYLCTNDVTATCPGLSAAADERLSSVVYASCSFKDEQTRCQRNRPL